MRVGFLGPEGTFSHEAALAEGLVAEAVALGSNHAVVVAVQAGEVDLAVVPIENSLEGAISQTLDALAFDAPDVAVVGERVRRIHHSLLAAPGLALAAVDRVVSHPQATGQCAGWLRRTLPDARVLAATSTAEAVRAVVAERGTAAAIGTRLAAERYGGAVLADDIQDDPDNVTRFVWLTLAGATAAEALAVDRDAPLTTSLLFVGEGDGAPGWLVRCLSEFAFRGVNLSRIESRPYRRRLGHYVFHVDCDGDASDEPVAAALAGLAGHCELVRVLGSYAAAPAKLRAGHGGHHTT